MEKQIWRGDIYYADLDPVIGSELMRASSDTYHQQQYGK